MYCRKCGAKIPDDSVFCQFCGTDIVNEMAKSEPTYTVEENYQPINNTPYVPPTFYSDPVNHKNRTRSIWKIFACLILVAAIISAIMSYTSGNNNNIVSDLNNMVSDINSSADSSSNSTSSSSSTTDKGLPAIEPVSGSILSGTAGYDSEITIKNNSEPCVVKLKDSYQNDVLAFYVRANEEVTVGVPGKYLYVYFASGETWYGYQNLFGENTYYSMDDEGIDFYEYTMTYTLYPVSNGNFTETPIDASDF